MQVWGFLSDALACGICAQPYRMVNRKGRHIWEGSRATNLCTCWREERGLAGEHHFAYGVTQNHFPFFLDFVVMWAASYARGTVWAELEQLGIGAARGRACGFI